MKRYLPWVFLLGGLATATRGYLDWSSGAVTGDVLSSLALTVVFLFAALHYFLEERYESVPASITVLMIVAVAISFAAILFL